MTENKMVIFCGYQVLKTPVSKACIQPHHVCQGKPGWVDNDISILDIRMIMENRLGLQSRKRD